MMSARRAVLFLQLLQKYEEEGLDPLVLIEPAIPGMPVAVLLADPEGDGPDQRRK